MGRRTMARHNLITLTVEELETIKEQAASRAEDLEWQLRREIARLREVEQNLLRIVGAAPPPPPAPSAAAVRRAQLRRQYLTTVN
jgi:hypothetical protein